MNISSSLCCAAWLASKQNVLARAIRMELTENGGCYVRRGFAKKRNGQFGVTTVVKSRGCTMDWMFPSERKKISPDEMIS